MTTEIDTSNDFLVGAQGNNVVVMLAGISMDRPAALRLAAWLVACSMAEPAEFDRVLTAVLNT